jgi:phage tail protein X
MEAITYSSQGDTIDDIAWRHYGATEGIVEGILADVRNYRLSRFSAALPIGTKIVLPNFIVRRPKQDIVLWQPKSA